MAVIEITSDMSEESEYEKMQTPELSDTSGPLVAASEALEDASIQSEDEPDDGKAANTVRTKESISFEAVSI